MLYQHVATDRLYQAIQFRSDLNQEEKLTLMNMLNRNITSKGNSTSSISGVRAIRLLIDDRIIQPGEWLVYMGESIHIYSNTHFHNAFRSVNSSRVEDGL